MDEAIWNKFIRWLSKTFTGTSLGTMETSARSYCTALSQYCVATAANLVPKYLIMAGNMANGAWATSAFGPGG